ncbi:hypothetical protein YPPY47_2238, partial [Yersinia pestis PY-47]
MLINLIAIFFGKRTASNTEIVNFPSVIVTNGAIVIHTQRLKSDPGGNL